MRPGGNPSTSFLFSKREPSKTASPVTRDLMAILDETGLSARRLSKSLGISNVALSNWRHGRRSPRLIEFEVAAEAVGYRLVLVPIEPTQS